MGRPIPHSAVVQSDDEVAADIAARIAVENAGQPQEWIDEEVTKAVAQELMERRDVQAWSQREYDKAAGNA